jgi:predicted permease
MNRIWQDVRYGIRMLANKPGFTAAAVVVLALGIGANSAVFSLINAFLLKPLHVQNPDELAGLYSRDTKHPDSYRAFSYPNYVDIRDDNPAFSSVAALNMALVGVQEGDNTRRTFAAVVSSNYFSTLGVTLMKGRAFLAEDEKPGGELTAIVTYPFWMKKGADPQLVGKPVRINGHLFTIVGITPKGFSGTTALVSPEVFVPLNSYGMVMNDFEGHVRPLTARDNHALMLVGRLKPGVTVPSADRTLAVRSSQMEKAYAENKDQALVVRPISRMSISTSPQNDKELRVPAIMLLSLAAVVLLIASLNLANMMMAKGTARRKEIAIRLAIGGSRRRIVRQLVTEGLLLAIAGGAAGLMVASWSTTLFVQSLAALAPVDIIYDARPDVRVLGFTLLFCALSTVVFALFPAWKLSNPDMWIDLKENTSEDAGGRKRRLFSRGNILVMAQLSLSLMMLSAAGLFIHSAVRAGNVQPGFSLENEVIAEMDASLIDYDEARGNRLYATLKERLRQMPGVQSVAIAATVPFGMFRLGKNINSSDVPVSKEHPAMASRYNIVSEDYFQTMGIPILRGRAFTSAECAVGSKSNVAILDKAAANMLWPGGDALGKRIHLDDAKDELVVVGVVGDILDNIIGRSDDGSRHVYVPFGKEYQANVAFHLKVTGRGPDMETVRREILAVDERLPVVGLKTMRGNLESSFDIWVVRTGAHILEIFGSVALLLAVIGLYALNAYTVARRTREIGIRMALGADAASALRMILGDALKVTMVGAGVGMILAMALGKVLAGVLYDIPGVDPLVIGAAPVVLGLVAMFACYLPARRASRVDPVIALRYE